MGQCIHPHFWVASSKSDPILFPATDPRLMSQVGHKENGGIQIKAPGGENNRHVALYGPYIALPKGKYRAELEIVVTSPNAQGATVDVCCSGGQVELYSRSCAAEELMGGLVSMDFATDQKVEGLEVRFFVPGGFTGSIKHLRLLALD